MQNVEFSEPDDSYGLLIIWVTQRLNELHPKLSIFFCIFWTHIHVFKSILNLIILRNQLDSPGATDVGIATLWELNSLIVIFSPQDKSR